MPFRLEFRAWRAVVPALVLLVGVGGAGSVGAEGGTVGDDPAKRLAADAPRESTGPMGMDEAVNERLAEEAGVRVREPYLDLESLGDLWNAILLLAGGACGFVLGRWSHLLWGRPESPPSARGDASGSARRPVPTGSHGRERQRA